MRSALIASLILMALTWRDAAPHAVRVEEAVELSRRFSGLHWPSAPQMGAALTE